jgi:hypothetical protein
MERIMSRSNASNSNTNNAVINSALNVTTAGTGPNSIEPWVGEAALRRTMPLVLTIANNEDDLPRINVDITTVVVSARGALPRIMALRPELIRQTPLYDFTLFDAFEDTITALGHTDSAVRAASKDREEITAQAEALDVKRIQLLETAVALSGFGLVDEKPLETIRKETGYRPLVSDVSTLVQLLRQNWPKIEGKVPYTLKALNAIDHEVLILSAALGLKERNREAPQEVALLRRQVYAVFRKSVASIRRAVTFLVGEDEVNNIVPTFANSPGKGARAAAAEEKSAPEESASDQPTAATRGKAAAPAVAPFKVNNPAQLPITSPFGEPEDGV